MLISCENKKYIQLGNKEYYIVPIEKDEKISKIKTNSGTIEVAVPKYHYAIVVVDSHGVVRELESYSKLEYACYVFNSFVEAAKVAISKKDGQASFVFYSEKTLKEEFKKY